MSNLIFVDDLIWTDTMAKLREAIGPDTMAKLREQYSTPENCIHISIGPFKPEDTFKPEDMFKEWKNDQDKR